MATVPEKEDPQPTPIARVKAAVSRSDYRIPAALAAAAAAGSLAPEPMGALVAALLVVVAWEARRR